MLNKNKRYLELTESSFGTQTGEDDSGFSDFGINQGQ